MAFVPGFDHDAFVSFRHVDNVPLGRRPPWVTSFVRDLKTYVQMLLGTAAELSIFFDGDCSLQSGEPVRNELMRAAAGSATFLPVLSPAYVAPGSWTLEELNFFYQSKRDGQRTFPIELLPLDDYPTPVQDLVRFQFWTRKGSAPVPIAPKSQALCDRLINLGYQMGTHLMQIRNDLHGVDVATDAR